MIIDPNVAMQSSGCQRLYYIIIVCVSSIMRFMHLQSAYTYIAIKAAYAAYPVVGVQVVLYMASWCLFYYVLHAFNIYVYIARATFIFTLIAY